MISITVIYRQKEISFLASLLEPNKNHRTFHHPLWIQSPVENGFMEPKYHICVSFRWLDAAVISWDYDWIPTKPISFNHFRVLSRKTCTFHLRPLSTNAAGLDHPKISPRKVCVVKLQSDWNLVLRWKSGWFLWVFVGVPLTYPVRNKAYSRPYWGKPIVVLFILTLFLFGVFFLDGKSPCMFHHPLENISYFCPSTEEANPENKQIRGWVISVQQAKNHVKPQPHKI